MEKLRDELARNVFELDSGLIMIHHKYYVGHYSEHPYAIKLANETFDAKKKELEEAKSKNDLSSIWVVTRPYRVPYVYDALQDWWKPNAKTYWDLIRYLWTDTENVYEHLDYWDELLNNYFVNDRHLIMSKDDKKYFDKLPNKINIFRGGVDDKGCSWTLDKSRAEWFANRFNRGYEVYEKTINKSDAIAYISDRNEDEIIYIGS